MGGGAGVGGRVERPKPRWEKREEVRSAWGVSTPKRSSSSSEEVKGGEKEGKGKDVDSLFG